MRKLLALTVPALMVFMCGKPGISRFQLAEQYRLLGNYDQALETYETALQHEENPAGSHFGMGMVYEARDRLADAEKHYRATMELRADFPGVITRMKIVQGKKLITQNEFDQAYAVLREVLITEVLAFRSGTSPLNENNERYFNRLSEALIRKGAGLEEQKEFDQAAAYYKKAVEMHSGSAAGHLRLGAMYRTQGKTLTALKHLQKAQQLDPEQAEAGYLLGHCYYELNDYEEAYREWLKVKAVRPGYRDTRKRLGMAWNKKMWEFLKFQTAVDSIALNLQEISRMKNELRQAVENYKQLGDIVERAGEISALKDKIDTVLTYQDRMAPMVRGLNGIAAMKGDLENAVRYQIVLKDILVGLEDISNMKEQVLEVIGHQQQTHEIVTGLAEIAAMKTDLKRAADYQDKVADVVAGLERIGRLKDDIKDVLKYQDKHDFAAIVEDLGQIAELKDELKQAKTTVALTLAMLGSQTKENQATLIATLERVREFITASDDRISEFILETTDKQLNAVVEDIRETEEAHEFVSDETVILWQQVITALTEKEKRTLIGYLALTPEGMETTMHRLDLSTTEKYLIEAVQSLDESEKKVVAGIANGTYSTSVTN